MTREQLVALKTRPREFDPIIWFPRLVAEIERLERAAETLRLECAPLEGQPPSVFHWWCCLCGRAVQLGADCAADARRAHLMAHAVVDPPGAAGYVAWEQSVDRHALFLVEHFARHRRRAV
jgi:hypothetical protein